MILGERHDPSNLDTASTHTLVVHESNVIPRHLLKLIYASLLLSTLAFAFAITNNIITIRSPRDVATAVFAYIFVLPHHFAILLLEWLRRHQTESIFPFAPSHPRALAYAFILVGLWAVSVTMCAATLHLVSGPVDICFISYAPNNTTQSEYCTTHIPSMINYWITFATTLTSGLELTLLIAITLVCCLHCRRKTVNVSTEAQAATSPPLGAIPGERKVLSA